MSSPGRIKLKGIMNRTRDTDSVALGTLVTVLEVTKEMSAPLPQLQVAVGGLLGVIKIAVKMSQNNENIRTLLEYFQKLNDLLTSSIPEGRPCPEALRQRVEGLCQTLDHMTEDLRRIRAQPVLFRTINTDKHAVQIEGLVKNLSWAINNFVIGGTIAIELAVDTLDQTVRQEFGRLNVKVDDLGDKIDGLVAGTKLNAEGGPVPRYAVAARFDYHGQQRNVCEQNTRLETLAAVYRWIRPNDSRLEGLPQSISDKMDAGVFWISGLAGSGKSTIAQTVAHWCHDGPDNFLGASFFCSRDSAECSNVHLIFPTIAYQLGLFHAGFKEEVSQVLRRDPDIQSALIARQLEELVVKPLRAVMAASHFPSCAVIIDALDECKDDQATSVIIAALSLYISDLKTLRFFITSRPVLNVTGAFRTTGLAATTQHLILHEVSADTTERDLNLYLEKRLLAVSSVYEIDDGWPSGEDLHSLVVKANGLFIFAATVVKYVSDPNADDPKEQLKRLLLPQTPTLDSSPYAQLDALYLQVLRDAFPKIQSQQKAKLKTVLGTAVLLRDPLSPVALEVLLHLPPRTVRDTLRRIHSVIVVPSAEDGVIRLIHPSFHDFLTDPQRCSEKDFVITASIQHTLVSQNCLRVLHTLERDTCGIGNVSVLNSEIPDLSERVRQHVPLHVQYACRHWAFHMKYGMIDDDSLELLRIFCEKYMLRWLEVLSLLGELDTAAEALHGVEQALRVLPVQVPDILSLLYDCERAILMFLPAIRLSCLQVYASIISFAPTGSRFRALYESEKMHAPIVRSGLEANWSPRLHQLEGHQIYVYSVAFSPGGERIASGAGDKTIRLWDAKTGAHLHTLHGHSSLVNCLAFSPDGRWLVSVSADRTVIVWDAETGGHLKTSGQQSHDLLAVSYFPDSQTIAIGCSDGKILMGKAPALDSFETLEGHPRKISAISISHSGLFLVSGSFDYTCKLWDPRRKLCTRTFKHSNSVYGAAISSDDKVLAAACGKGTITLWSLSSGSSIRVLKGHSDAVDTVCFSPDNSLIASGSWDKSIRLWNTSNGVHLRSLEGHTRHIRSVQFSPDGLRLVSGSDDNSIYIWDTTLAASVPINNNHASTVTKVAISPDRAVFCTGSTDNTIRVWDTTTGDCLKTLQGHPDTITSIAFSADGKHIASSDMRSPIIRLWDVTSGQCTATLQGHTAGVRMVTYHPNGHQLISCSSDSTIRLWALGMTRPATTIFEGEGTIYTMALSPVGDILAAVLQAKRDGARSEVIKVFDLSTKACVCQLNTQITDVLCLSFSLDGSRLLSGAANGQILLFDSTIDSGKGPDDLLMEVIHAGQPIEQVSFASDQKSIVSDVSVHDISPEHQPLSVSANEASTTSISPAHFFSEGWIWTTSDPRRRLCWVPPTYRYQTWMGPIASRGSMATVQNTFILGTEDGKVVLIDLTPC